MQRTFVLAVCGDRHVADANQALAFLKRFCREEIVVVAARCGAPLAHDQVVWPGCPAELSDLAASRYLKTGLCEILGPLAGLCCYLDNDVVAVSPEAGRIFEHFRPPVGFALDQSGRVTVERFSPWALREGDLRQAIAEKFGVAVDAGWRIWNGGVFLFDRSAAGFMKTWQEYTLAAFADPLWHPRDQGALVAAVFRHGLEGHVTVPDVFNWMPRHSLGRMKFSRLRFVHFIDGYNDPEWSEWTATRDLLARSSEG